MFKLGKLLLIPPGIVHFPGNLGVALLQVLYLVVLASEKLCGIGVLSSESIDRVLELEDLSCPFTIVPHLLLVLPALLATPLELTLKIAELVGHDLPLPGQFLIFIPLLLEQALPSLQKSHFFFHSAKCKAELLLLSELLAKPLLQHGLIPLNHFSSIGYLFSLLVSGTPLL